MILNGQTFTTIEDLEAYMTAQNISEDQKAFLRDEFYGNTDCTPSQAELDRRKYLKRSMAIATMMSEMAAENVGRVRSGLWTVNDLVGLTQDAQIKEILTDIYSLSFEIAYGKIDAVTNSLITSDIKTAWKAKLAANF